jgi:hypothetical protein
MLQGERPVGIITLDRLKQIPRGDGRVVGYLIIKDVTHLLAISKS